MEIDVDDFIADGCKWAEVRKLLVFAIYCRSFEVEKFCSFHTLISNHEMLPLKSRRVVVNCEAKKKQHMCAFSGLYDHYSELFTWMTTLNF